MSWYKPLSGRDSRGSVMAVLLMNNLDGASDLSFRLSDVPGLKERGAARKGYACNAWDVNDGKSLGVVSGDGFTAKAVASHDAVFITLSECK